MGWARRGWGHHEAGLGEEGQSLAAAGRVEGGNAGPAVLDHSVAVVAAASVEDTRHDGQGVHRMEQVAEGKERRSIPVAAEEAGRSPVGEDNDPAEEGHHEEHRIVVEGTEAVDSLADSPEVVLPEEVRPEEVRPEDNRKALVVLQQKKAR